MSKVFFIDDRFTIKDRGYVYSGKLFPKDATLLLGEVLYDFSGNGFEITGIEMFRRFITQYEDSFDYPIGFLVKNIGNLNAQGDILTDGPIKVNYIFGNDIQVQLGGYEIEYIAAQDNGNRVALFDYGDLVEGNLNLYGDEIEGLTIYRGKRMPFEMYKSFYKLCKKNNVILINDPFRYENCHILKEKDKTEAKKPKTIKVVEQYRVVIALGNIISVSASWNNTDESLVDDISKFAIDSTKNVRNNFYIVDIDVNVKGELSVADVCDAQVAELSGETPENYYKKLDELFGR